ncbi:MAG: hypothetical protein VKN72_04765 [Nostocales cyanobacterium 94392]|nr:hypothetical protein [Nostocales cyanobacterium 94392]
MTLGNFISEIENYESDTFSAQRAKITRKEAEEVAERLLNNWSLDHLDGQQIGTYLSLIRHND